MVKRICPACGKKCFTAAKQATFECTCGAKLGPELNKGIGESEVNSLAHFPVIGTILDSGHNVIANYKNEFILAEKETSDGMEYVTYYLDPDGKPYSGYYDVNLERAERNFTELCFKWFENKEDLCVCPL